MASVEFIQKRIEGKEKELEKLNKKMDRILKAKATNWEVNPYWYREDDIRSTNKDIESCQKALQTYRIQLETENEKAQSRNIPVIIEFLDNWKQRVFTYYAESVPKYLAERTEYYEWCHIHNETYDWRWQHDHSAEECKAVRREYKDKESAFHQKWNWLIPYIEHNALNEEKVKKDLDREANAKYDFIIDRTNQIVKVITDATNLRIGAKGDLNGFIIGTGGTAKVTTIDAGGYNIQCYHFRTLVSPFKG